MAEPATRDERRRAALEAARELLRSAGPSGVSMRKLAAATRTAINTLYAMFGSRDGVLRSLVEDAVAQRLEALRGADVDARPIDALRSLVTASVRHAVDHADTTKPMYRAASQLRGLREVANAAGLELFTRRLDDAVRAGELRDEVGTRPLAELLMQTVNETSLAWALDEIDDDHLEARCGHALAVVLAAAAAPATSTELATALERATERLERLQRRGRVPRPQ